MLKLFFTASQLQPNLFDMQKNTEKLFPKATHV